MILTSIFDQKYFFEVGATAAWIMLALLTPIYFYLHIYLSSVIPDSYGVTESCCFCLRKKRPVEEEIDEDLVENDLQASTIQDLLEENHHNRLSEQMIP